MSAQKQWRRKYDTFNYIKEVEIKGPRFDSPNDHVEVYYNLNEIQNLTTICKLFEDCRFIILFGQFLLLTRKNIVHLS